MKILDQRRKRRKDSEKVLKGNVSEIGDIKSLGDPKTLKETTKTNEGGIGEYMMRNRSRDEG